MRKKGPLRKNNAVFTMYYGPGPSMKFYKTEADMPGRIGTPWMVGVAMQDGASEWAPGVQRTFVGACWAMWKQYRKMRKEQ